MKGVSLHSEQSPDRYRHLVLGIGAASVGTAVTFVLLKAAVWRYSGSATIFASLTDSVFDLFASLLNFAALRYSLQPADREHRFGHFKAQSLAALAQAAFIGGSAVLLIIHGLERCAAPQPLQHATLAIAVSVVTLIGTVVLVTFQSYVCRLTHSDAVAADRLHYVSDLLLNGSVILALVLSDKGFWWADGLFAAFIGLLILRGAYEIGSQAADVLLDHALPTAEHDLIVSALSRCPGVQSFHDLKTRRAGPQRFIQCHLVIDGGLTLTRAHAVASEAERRLHAALPEAEITLHMEPDERLSYQDMQFPPQDRRPAEGA